MTNAKTLEEFEKNIVLDERIIKEIIKSYDLLDSSSRKENKIAGNIFCITGTLTQSRKDVQKLIENNGGIFSNSVTRNTNFLVIGEKTGQAKIRDAAKYSVKIIDEYALREMLPDSSSSLDLNSKIEEIKKEIIRETWFRLASAKIDEVRACVFTASSEHELFAPHRNNKLDGILEVYCFSGNITSLNKNTKIITSSYC